MEWPFHRMVVLGYYDGPTDGIIQCANCSEEYRFDLLDADWDAATEVPRIFSLTPMPPGSLEQLAAECQSEDRAPDWSRQPCHVWPHWDYPSPAEREAADRRIREILGQGTEPAWVAAWWTGDEERGITSARRLSPADSLHVQYLLSLGAGSDAPLHPDPAQRRDWFAFLGIARPERDPDTWDEEEV
jgi:hypothetical protein